MAFKIGKTNLCLATAVNFQGVPEMKKLRFVPVLFSLIAFVLPTTVACAVPVSDSTSNPVVLEQPTESDVISLNTDLYTQINNAMININSQMQTYAASPSPTWPHTFTSGNVTASIDYSTASFPMVWHETISGITVGGYTVSGSLIVTLTNQYENTTTGTLTLTGGVISTAVLNLVSSSPNPPTVLKDGTITVNGYVFDVSTGHYK